MWNWVQSAVWMAARDEGATAVEYALMIAMIALVIVGSVTALGLSIPGLFQPVSDILS
jgi:pilus assembly protein Flp/PilA